MGTGKDFISSILADKLIPFMRRPVEDIIYETLDRRQTPSRKDFHELRDQINTIKGKVTNATSGLRKLGEQIETVDDAVSDMQASLDGKDSDPSSSETDKISSIEDTIAALKATISVLNDKLNHQNSIIEDQSARIAELSKQPVATDSVAEMVNCKVPTCDEPIRARGFCRACYAKWSRGTLGGFVGKDGIVNGVSLEKRDIAQAYKIVGNDIIVNGNKVGTIST